MREDTCCRGDRWDSLSLGVLLENSVPWKAITILPAPPGRGTDMAVRGVIHPY